MFNRTYHLPRLHRSLIVAGLAIVLITLSASFAFAESPVSFSTTLADAPSCRYGTVSFESPDAPWVGPLKLGWHLNFSFLSTSGFETVGFAPVIRVKQDRVGCERKAGYTFFPALTDEVLGAIIRGRPGALWIVGNEPDRGPNPEDLTCENRVQDDTEPQVYARAYHDAYAFIKRTDPAAQVAPAGLVQVTPGRLQYWDIVWNTYRSVYGVDMPADAWNMHLYVLPEANADGQPNGIANIAIGTNPALAIRWSGGNPALCAEDDVYCYAEHDDMTEFARQIVSMREWMKDHDEQDKPLLLTEYSLLYPYEIDNPADPSSCYLKDEYGQCFTPERVATFADRSLSYLDTVADPEIGYPRDGNRLVQRWVWYSVKTTGVGYVSNLLNNARTAMSVVGQAYANRATAAPRTWNLYPKAVFGAYDASLTVEVRNAGSIPTTKSNTVSFYRDAALTSLIGSVTVPAGLDGCDSESAKVSVKWPNLGSGEHAFWVKVDAGGVIDETQEDDNVMQGTVIVPNYRLTLPLALRNAR